MIFANPRNARHLLRHLSGVVPLFVILAQASSSQAPETFSQALTRHHIALTKPALLMALADSDKEVRGLAAAELAEMKAVDTIPEIMRAAEAEKEGLTQVNIAAAATWMGSSEGLGLLKKLCREPSLSPYARQNAARTIFDKGDHACFTEIADMIRPSFDTGTRIGALYLLSQLHDRTEEETKLVLARLVVALSDPESRMRLEACQGLRWLHDAGAVAPLRAAIVNEHEEFTRTEMQSVLEFLLKPKSEH